MRTTPVGKMVGHRKQTAWQRLGLAAVLLCFSVSTAYAAPPPDPWADAVHAQSGVTNAGNAIGAANGNFAYLPLLGASITLDMGEDEEGTGNLVVHYGNLLSVGLASQVEFLDQNLNAISSSSLLLSLGLGTFQTTVPYSAAPTPYRYVRISGLVSVCASLPLTNCGIDAVQAVSYITETYTPTSTPSHTPTASYTPTASQTATPTNTASNTHTATHTSTASHTATHTFTASHTPTATLTPSQTSTGSPPPTGTQLSVAGGLAPSLTPTSSPTAQALSLLSTAPPETPGATPIAADTAVPLLAVVTLPPVAQPPSAGGLPPAIASAAASLTACQLRLGGLMLGVPRLLCDLGLSGLAGLAAALLAFAAVPPLLPRALHMRPSRRLAKTGLALINILGLDKAAGLELGPVQAATPAEAMQAFRRGESHALVANLQELLELTASGEDVRLLFVYGYGLEQGGKPDPLRDLQAMVVRANTLRSHASIYASLLAAWNALAQHFKKKPQDFKILMTEFRDDGPPLQGQVLDAAENAQLLLEQDGMRMRKLLQRALAAFPQPDELPVDVDKLFDGEIVKKVLKGKW